LLEQRRVSGRIRWDMKEYKLGAWPELAAPFHRTAYRRMLSDMSHRYMSVSGLVLASGATKLEVRQFLDMLADKGLLLEREGESDSLFDSLKPVGDWVRRNLFRDLSRH
jgi:hypothetical protein